MAKQVYKIESFHGGLNDNSDPRDIEQNEFSVLKGVAVDELGVIRMMGKPNSSAKITEAATLEPGNGLVTYKTDKDKDAADNPTEWLGIYNDADGNIGVYYDGVNQATGNNTFDSQNTPKPGADFIDVGTDGSAAKISSYFSDGRLRVCDSDYSNNSGQSLLPQYAGYVSENLFHTTKESTSNGTPVHKLGKWQSGNQELKTFDDLSVTLALHQGDVTDSETSPNATLIGDGGTKKIVMAYWRTKNGNWNGVFQFGFCPIYDGNQEAAISICSTLLPAVNQKLNVQFFIPMGTANTITSNTAHKLGDDRITGMNVYFRRLGDEEFKLFQHVDLTKGGEFHWKVYNASSETGHGIWDDDDDSLSLSMTTNGSAASATDSYDETTVGAVLTIGSSGFSGRKGFIRLYGFEPGTIYHAINFTTVAHEPISVRLPKPGLNKFQIELLDEQFNVVKEGAEVEYTVTDSGAEAFYQDQDDENAQHSR